MSSPTLRSVLVGSTSIVSLLAALSVAGSGCAAVDDDGEPAATADEAIRLTAHRFDIGMNEWVGEFASYDLFRSHSPQAAPDSRLCHVYTYWNIANEDPPDGDQTHTLAGLEHWFSLAENHCDDVLVTFQGKQHHVPEGPPSTRRFEQAFVDFQRLTEPGQPLAAWARRLSFTAWNEPDNTNPSGSGLTEDISPEQAAAYYLAIRQHCDPAEGCKVAAGDFATDGSAANHIEWNCANDNDPRNTPTHCAEPSSFNPHDRAPSYLDRYKNFIATHAHEFGLHHGFRPEYFAYHPWHDVNSYLDSYTRCDSYEHCVTRRLLQSLGGSWGVSEIWDDEIGVGLQTNPAPDPDRQACGAAFLVQLTSMSPRIRRVYYMTFRGGNGPLIDHDQLNPAGEILASHAMHAPAHLHCPATGL